MSEYTPTTEWVRIMVGYAMTTAADRTKSVDAARAEGYEWFDRWLAAHDESAQGITATTNTELGALLARWDVTERPDGWNSGDEHHLADLIITALRGA